MAQFSVGANKAGLQPQQVPQAGLDVEYPLSLSLVVGAALASAARQCPTHPFTTIPGQDGSVRMELAPGAKLDRDVVVLLTPRETRPSLLVHGTDVFQPSTPVVMMAAMQPPVGVPRDRIVIKLLVDCSRSMRGDSIASARAALRGVAAGLTERDHLSLTRFGSSAEHLFAPSPAKPQALRHVQSLIDSIQADLGGTEMRAALSAVFDLPNTPGHTGADVLLLTDGEIWQGKEMIAAARRSGHRVFAIGVGSAPAEGVLRAIAEATGGACEFATPGEALEAAARRMLDRMRQPVFTNVRIDWGDEPTWSSDPGPALFGGDTVTAMAGFQRPIRATAIRLLADDSLGNTVELARGEADAPCTGDSLARIAAARRIMRASSGDALALGLRYQIMGKQTSCILVHPRAEADKVAEQAHLHQVRSMMAAGWAGAGTVARPMLDYSEVVSPALMCSRSMPLELSLQTPGRHAALPALSQTTGNGHQPASLKAMARYVGARLSYGRRLQELLANIQPLTLHADAQQALDDVVQLGLMVEQAWLLLAHWTNTRSGGLSDADLATLLEPLVEVIESVLTTAAIEIFERRLGGYPVDTWTRSSIQRLRRALSQITGNAA